MQQKGIAPHGFCAAVQLYRVQLRDAGGDAAVEAADDDSREGWARSHGVQAMNHDVPFPPLGGAIFQEYYDTPTYCGRQCVVGGFIVYGEPAGLTFREDNLKTTNDTFHALCRTCWRTPSRSRWP